MGFVKCFIHFNKQFKNQNPARGRKLRKAFPCYSRSPPYLRTRTPQGDGNTPTSRHTRRNCAEFKNQNPARGRKPTSSRRKASTSSIPFKNQNPARGRKLLHPYSSQSSKSLFKNQNPARGRKPSVRRFFSSSFVPLRTRTPQGDGNYANGEPKIFSRML